MGDIHYLKDIPKGTYTFDRKTAVVTIEVFKRLADYTRSCPTGPKPGRIYKKLGNWDEMRKYPDHESFWWVYYCIRDPKDPKYVLHIPRRLLVV